MRAVRGTLIVVGVVLLASGGWWLLTRQDLPQLVGVMIWLAAVVVVHDGVLSAASALRHRLRRSAPPRDPDERTP
ncbi:hypothetical protein [Microbacterium phyllosphaerae]|uniref:hypothetical protein n=1 Tax=Microbacterium phyllosphaerae TaxID=124798 RepID=UPI003D648299